MPAIYCLCGDTVSKKAFDKAVELKADSFRCEICLEIWLESPHTRANLRGEKIVRTKLTPEKVEQCSFDGLSVKDAAERIGVTEGTFKNAIWSKGSKLREAWNRGKERRGNLQNTEKPAEKKSKSRFHRKLSKPSRLLRAR